MNRAPRSRMHVLGVAFVLVLAVVAASSPAEAATSSRSVGTFRLAGGSFTSGRALGSANLRVLESRQSAAAPSAATTLPLLSVPMWTDSTIDGGTKFTYTMVGKNPFQALRSPSTSVPTWVIAVNVVSGSDTFSAVNSDGCDPGGVSALDRAVASPIFKKKSYVWGGTAVDDTVNLQYVDAFQRAEFWSQTNPAGLNPGYHVNLALGRGTDHVLATTIRTYSYPEYTGTCGNLLAMDLSVWDSWVQNALLPSLQTQYGIGPTAIPVILVHNVAFYNGSSTNCCVLGYHRAIGTPAQTYIVADYENSGAYSGTAHADVAVLSHEVAEWMDDPLTTNPTNPWGHVGQVSGCQSNLEVGDPFNTSFRNPLGGFNYHVQELAFFSWFYHQSPSIGINGWYSNRGTFTSPAAACS